YNCNFATPQSWKPSNSTPSPTISPICSVAPRICGGIFDFDVKSERLDTVNAELEDPGIWNDAKRAQDLGKEKKALELVVSNLRDLDTRLKDADELFALAREEGDDATLHAVEGDVDTLDKRVADMEFRRMFANPMDPN